MMVPTGSGRLATSTSGPAATTAFADAAGAPAPENIFLAVMAVTAATTSAPISSTSFFTSMTPIASCPLLKSEAYTSAKMVKEPFANQPETAESDCDPVRDFEFFLPLAHPVADQHRNREQTARDRHQQQQLHHRERGQPQSHRSDQLDVAAAHRLRHEG